MSFPLYLPSSRPTRRPAPNPNAQAMASVTARGATMPSPTGSEPADGRPGPASANGKPGAGRLTGVGEPVRRTPSDITLAVIFAELTAARAANQAERGAPRIGNAGGPRADRLLVSLETCVRALQDRNLPIPPTLRDELRLRRALYPTHRR